VKVYLKPAAGSARDNLESAKVEMERVVGFRGKVTGARAEGKRILVTIEVSPKWGLAEEEKVPQLSEWIKAKTKTLFTVQSIK